jgi:uncharacterized membrane protein (UPF0127 family)
MATSGSHWRFGALIFVAFAVSASQPGAGRAEGGLEKLEIDTASGPHILQVEVMHTEQERERGLMFRKYLPKDRGMLFDFPVEQPVMMWMKNTYIPLDMVFVDHNGRVVGIARNAEPLSETIIPSGAPAAGVLEINGGEAAALGLETGDVVHHPLFKN